MNQQPIKKHHSTKKELVSLKPHAKQNALFCELPEQAIQRLAEDIACHGLQNPVQILSDGTIICGHQRVAAAKSLGWEEIDVVIRSDLEEQGEKAIEEALIGDNLHRRQLDPIEKARCIQRLREIHAPDSPKERSRRKTSKEAHGYEKGLFRDYLGKEFGMSGRSIDRYLAVLKTPKEIQNAVSANQLPLTEAVRVSGLAEVTQTAIADEISNGGDVREVVQRHLQNQKASPTKSATTPKCVERHIKQVERAQADLAQLMAKGSTLTDDQRNRLKDAMSSLHQLVGKPTPVKNQS